jgi:uncharacterized protein (TIGR03437 family)
MRVRGLLCLALSIAARAMAQSPGFLLGVDYSEWLPLDATQIATDSYGALYILSVSDSANSFVTKLSADGTKMLWQNQLGFVAVAMAVDPYGGVYVVPASQSWDTSFYVAKLSAGGTGVAWETPVGFIPNGLVQPVLAADNQGRAYLAAQYDLTNVMLAVVRLNAAGSAVDYTARVPGTPTSIAVDQSDAAFVAGYTGAATGFLARLAPDGSAGFQTSLPEDSYPAAVAVDANGDAAVFGGGVLQRVNSAGAVTLSMTVTGSAYGGAFALDAAGNAYIVEATSQLFQVKNSLATCGTGTGESVGILTVIAPDGSVLQTTYISGSQAGMVIPRIATAPNSTVFAVATAGPSFAPTQPCPFPAGTFGTDFLVRLSPNANAQTYPLACVANGASFEAGAIAPGEIVTLFGTGLGPQQGVQPQATLQSPYPTQAANVEVSFDGTAAPLLWVQNQQINAVAPWSLTPGQNTQVCVSYNNANTNCLTWPVAQVAPAVFTVDGLHAAAVNQDGTINSADNPAPVGSIVAVWATGLGPIAPAPADGTLVGLPLPNNVLPVVLEVLLPAFEPCHPGTGPVPCPFPPSYSSFEVTYAGPAPYKVAGASQINFAVVDYAPAWAADNPIILNLLSSVQSPGFQVYVAGQ